MRPELLGPTVQLPCRRESAEWQHANKVVAATAWLTAAQSKQAAAEMQEVLQKYGGYRDETDRPPQARQVRLVVAIALDVQNIQSDEQ